MKPFINADHATKQAWWWLSSNITDGLLLSICTAIMEEDLERLEAICKIAFMRQFNVAQSSANCCNTELSDLNLAAALRMERCSASAVAVWMGLYCEDQKLQLHVLEQHRYRDQVSTNGYRRNEKAATDGVLADFRLALIRAIENRTVMVQT